MAAGGRRARDLIRRSPPRSARILGLVDADDGQTRRVRRVPAMLAVLALLVPLVLAGPRLMGVEAPGWLVLLASFERQVLVAALVALAAALLARSRTLAFGTAVVAALWVVWVGPQLVGVLVPRTVEPEGLTVRLITANLYYRNPRVEEALAALAAEDADVIVLQEVDERAAAALRAGALGEELQLLGMVPRSYPYGWAVLSRYPGTAEEVEIGGETTGVVALTTPSGPLRVADVHTIPPLAGLRDRWRDGLADLAALPSGGAPLVLAGDFNATPGHLGFRRILAAGMRDASVAAGRGWISTWPAGLPVAHLDHVLVPETIGVVAAGELDLPGSDHRGVRVDLDVR